MICSWMILDGVIYSLIAWSGYKLYSCIILICFLALLVYNYTIFYALHIKLGKMYIHKVLLHIVPCSVCKK